MKYLADLQKYLHGYANENNALPMKKYMRDKFKFLGIKTPYRRELIRYFVSNNGWPPREMVEGVVIGLYSLPYREFHYTALEIAERLMKRTIPEDIYIIEYMLDYNQWWDSVDFVATTLAGRWHKEHPGLSNKYFSKWNKSDDMWLNRAAILYQLKYKKTTDLNKLTSAILQHAGSKEFFHRKAIGWALREYAKTDPEWVKKFIVENELSGLSKREAMKNMKEKI